MMFWRVFEKRGVCITEEIDGAFALQLLSQRKRDVSPIARERLRQLEAGEVIEGRFACGYTLVRPR